MYLSSTVTRSMSVSAERLKEWPILGSRMRSRFHLTAFGVDRLAVVELRAAAQLEGPGLEVLRGVPLAGDGGNDVHARIEVEQPAGRAGQRLGDEVDEVAMGIETDGIVARAEAHACRRAWGCACAAASATPGRPASAAPASAVVAVRNLRLVLSGPFLFASSVMTSPPRSVCLGRSWLCDWNAYSIGCLLTGSRLRVRSPTGQTYWCAVQNSVPSFPVKVNAREHGIK